MRNERGEINLMTLLIIGFVGLIAVLFLGGAEVGKEIKAKDLQIAQVNRDTAVGVAQQITQQALSNERIALANERIAMVAIQAVSAANGGKEQAAKHSFDATAAIGFDWQLIAAAGFVLAALFVALRQRSNG